MIDRRNFLRGLCAGTLSAVGLPGCLGAGSSPAPDSGTVHDAPGSSRPNILFIVVDDLRPQLGCYGFESMVTPCIDRLAARGALFERAYCNVPVCGPSRVSVLSGVRPNSNQWRCSDLKSDFITLPALFRRHGYHALSNGKVLHHLGDRREDWSEPPWRSAEIYHGKEDWARYNTYGVWQDKRSAEKVNANSKRGPYCEAADVPDSAYQDGQVADRTIADLARMKATGKPFFLACGFWRPHLPFNAPRKYWDLYRREEIEPAPNRFRPSGLPAPCVTSREIDGYALTGKRKSEEAFHREARHAYFACVSYVDAQVGRVMQALDDLGLAGNTIVVLWGDHGWNLGEHDFWGKHNTLHNSLHAPLIFAAPGVAPGNRTRRLAEFVDIYPTLCELAGIPVPGHVQGDSLVPLLHDAEREWKPAVFSRWSGCNAVKTDRYLYTEWRKKGKVAFRMLFDHEHDPMENRNIAGDPAAAAVVQRMSRLLQEGWTSARPQRAEKNDATRQSMELSRKRRM